MRDKFPVVGAPRIEEAEIDEAVASLRRGWPGAGLTVARFEGAARVRARPLERRDSRGVGARSAALYRGAP